VTEPVRKLFQWYKLYRDSWSRRRRRR